LDQIRTIAQNPIAAEIGARITCVTKIAGQEKPHRQIDEVRSGGGYYSQNDLRVHFGLGEAQKVD